MSGPSVVSAPTLCRHPLLCFFFGPLWSSHPSFYSSYHSGFCFLSRPRWTTTLCASLPPSTLLSLVSSRKSTRTPVAYRTTSALLLFLSLPSPCSGRPHSSALSATVSLSLVVPLTWTVALPASAATGTPSTISMCDWVVSCLLLSLASCHSRP
ncbi:hypothetical protein BC629DRAFT_1548460 [Irpex lacteus]|nr:hypothetical protein BC629DRAFT_1548460 [Irpex lacteus]